jgi:chromosome segregation ATPase
LHEELQINLQNKEALLVQCRQDCEKYEDEVMDLQVKHKEIEEHSKEKDERIEILTRDVSSLKEELATIKMERSQLSLKNASLHATVTTRDKDIQRLSSKRENSTALLERVKDKEQECKDLKEQLHEAEGKKQELANQLSEHVADNTGLKRELQLVQSALKENQSEKERCLSQKQGQIDSFQMQLKQVISYNGNLQTRLNEANEEVRTVKKEFSQETASATKYKRECDEERTKLKELKVTLDLLVYVYIIIICCLCQLVLFMSFLQV